MSYSLASKFVSELVGMTLTMFLGESILANELLPGTKGHEMGFLAVALGFGLAFGVSIAWFGHISAHLNPAMLFFLAILDKLEGGWVEFVVLSCAEFLGAFLGATLVYLQFAAHFVTIPLPRDRDPVAVMLHGFPDAVGGNAARIASAFGPESKGGQQTLRQELRDVGKNVRRRYDREELLQKMEMRKHKQARAGPPSFYHSPNRVSAVRPQSAPNFLRQSSLPTKHADNDELSESSRHSIQVAGLLHTYDDVLPTNSAEFSESSRHSIQVAGLLHKYDNGLGDKKNDEVHCSKNEDLQDMEELDAPDVTDNEDGRKAFNAAKKANGLEKFSIFPAKPAKYADDDHKEAFNAAIDADALAKLSIFATRPAKYFRPANFYQEMIATAVLVFGAEMLHLRREFDSTTAADGPFLRALFVSLFITLLILGLGGTTGLAANPARDGGPRLAHALLPIPGKGSSEWNYGWVPLLAPFVGAAIGAGLFVGIEGLYETGGEPI